MPIKPSAKKAMRGSRRKALINLKLKRKLETLLKKASPQNIAEIQSVLDKAVKNGVIHKNKASRLKSRLLPKLAGKNPLPRVKKSAPAKKPVAKKPVAKTKTKSKKG